MRLLGIARQIHGSGRWVAGVAALFLALVSLVTASALWREHRLTLQQSRAEASTMSALLGESTARTFDSVDIVLAGLTQHFSSPGVATNDPTSQQMMRSLLRQLPTVRALFVIGPDGYIVHDTDYPATPHVSLADRAYFRAYVAQPALDRHLSEPLQSRSGLGWFIAYSRRLTMQDGRFGGIVVAAVQLDRVSQGYRQLGFGDRLQLSLFKRDGRLLARYPDDGHTGASYAGDPVFLEKLARSDAGVFGAGGSSGAGRIVSYRALSSQPLVVEVAIDRDAALAGWKRTTRGAALALALLAMLTAGGLLTFLQRRRERDRALAQQALALQAAADAARLQELAQELAEANERKSDFLATLSHELRNAVSPLQNCLTILQRVDRESDAGRRAAAIMRNQLGQIQRLLDDLLDVARLNSGKVHLDLQRLDLRDVVAAALGAAQPAVDAAGHRLSHRWPGEPVWVMGDQVRLLQVLSNLLTNAIKYTPPGRGEIAVSLQADGEHALLRVRDNGLGIPPADQARVFDMFMQVRHHRDHAHGGLGIGLALVARLTALHGGAVDVASGGDGAGSTFTVSLPLASAAGSGEETPVPDSARSTR